MLVSVVLIVAVLYRPVSVSVQVAGGSMTVPGLHAGIEAAVLMLLSAVTPVLMLISGASAVLPIATSLVQATVVLVGLSQSRLSSVAWCGAVVWVLLAQQLFFSTAHRCTFNTIQFDAAFVGFDAFSFYVSGTSSEYVSLYCFRFAFFLVNISQLSPSLYLFITQERSLHSIHSHRSSCMPSAHPC